jgi:polygalacturonase
MTRCLGAKAKGDDDRVLIQAAIDAAVAASGGTVCLAVGGWTLDRTSVRSYNRFAALLA